MPPEIVGELLWAAIDLPAPEHVEAFVVEQEDSARPVALGIAQRADVNCIGSAMNRMRAAIAGFGCDLLGLYRAHDTRAAAVRLGIDDVDARGAQPRHDQVAALDVRMRRIGT